MELREILQLEASYDSINLIKEFLNKKNHNSYDYSLALAHMAFLLFTLGNVNEAFKLLIDYNKKCENRFKPAIFDCLIKIYYEQHDYDNVKQNIEIKANFLPSYNKVNYYEDLIKYYETIGDKENLIKSLNTYLSDDINEERRLNALIILTDLYIELERYSQFKEKNPSLKSLALKLHKEENYKEACYNDALALTKMGVYDEALKIINDLLNNGLSKDLKALSIGLKVEILTGLNELRQASIFESENESEVDLGSVDSRIKFANACIKLYEKLDNSFSIKSYKNKISQLLILKENESLTNVTVKKKTFNIPLEQNIYDFDLIDESNEEDIKETEVEKTKKVNNITNEEKALMYDNISSLFAKINNINEELNETIRLFFVSLKDYVIFEECFMIYKNLQFHYKKERLYSKHVELNGSITFNTFNRMEEAIIFDTNKTDYKNPITNIMYADSSNLSAISLPFKDGAITFVSSNYDLINKDLNYETLLLATTYLETLFVRNDTIKDSLNQSKAYMNFIDNENSGIKYLKDNYITLSKEAAKLLGINTTDTLPSYLMNLEANDVIKYNQIIKELLSGAKKEASLIYKFKDKNILEEFKVNKDEIYSIVKDAKDIIEKEKADDFKANYDPIAKAFNKQKLVADLNIKVKSGRFSIFTIIEDDYNKYFDLYGKDFSNQLAYAICKFLNEYPTNKLDVYYYGENNYIVIIDDIVDKRTILNIASNIRTYLHDKLFALNCRVDSSFKMAILRYPTDTMKQNVLELINDLLSSVSNQDITIYDKKIIQNRMFESQLHTFISEAIDNNQLKLYYNETVDLLNNCPYAFKARINLSNYSVPEDKIFDIANKRHMIPMIEKYIIHRGMFELKELYDQIKLPYKFIFEVSKETILEANFISYIVSQKDFFKVPSDRFMILYNDSLDDNVIKVLRGLKEAQIMLMTNNDMMIKNVLVNAFLFNSNNMNENLGINYFRLMYEYCNSLKIDFVIGNINKPDDISVYSVYGVKYYTGPYYKRKLSIDSLKKMVEE